MTHVSADEVLGAQTMSIAAGHAVEGSTLAPPLVPSQAAGTENGPSTVDFRWTQKKVESPEPDPADPGLSSLAMR